MTSTTKTSYRLVWDGLGLDRPGSGIYYHASSLAKALAELGLPPTLVSQHSLGEDFSSFRRLKPAHSPIVAALPEKIGTPIQSYAKVRTTLDSSKTVFHGLSNINLPCVLKKTSRIPLVLTVHDIIPLIAPTQVSSRYALQARVLFPMVIRHADQVTCVSRWTAESLAERYPEVRSRLAVVPNGIEKQPVLTRRRVPSEVINILSIGRLEKYKRLDRIISLLRSYKDRLRATIVTNAKGAHWCFSRAPELIRTGRLNVQKDLSRLEIFNLYQNVDVYVHPSHYEGFCLPAAEALTCGLPVVYQRGSGIDEVVGESVGRGVDAQAGTDDWIFAIEDAYRVSLEESFSQLVHDHLQQMSSWKDSANHLKSLYEQLV